MPDQFICEPIRPVVGTMDARAMIRGEPGLPHKFIWRDEEYTLADVLETWKETAPCRSGSPERYVRKHWFRIRTSDGREMKIYFERQSRSGRQSKMRWWLYSASTIKRGQPGANE